MSNPFTPAFDKLPLTLPIFPLPGAVVMPGTQLPLNIFEPRYLNMVFDTLGESRMIGMVQPDPNADDVHGEAVYRTGTAGRITSFSETGDGRLLIILSGVCRFDIREEISTTRGYRRVTADWSRFAGDYETDPDISIERATLIKFLKAYSNTRRLETDWDSLEHLKTPALVDLLIDQLPLEIPDRQALIEAVTADERARLLLGLLDMSVSAATAPAPERPQ